MNKVEPEMNALSAFDKINDVIDEILCGDNSTEKRVGALAMQIAILEEIVSGGKKENRRQVRNVTDKIIRNARRATVKIRVEATTDFHQENATKH